jgi:hypothetical protein
MLRRVALVRTVVSEKLRVSVVPISPILVILMKEGLSSSETSVLTKATRRNIPEDTEDIFPYVVAGGPLSAASNNFRRLLLFESSFHVYMSTRVQNTPSSYRPSNL